MRMQLFAAMMLVLGMLTVTAASAQVIPEGGSRVLAEGLGAFELFGADAGSAQMRLVDAADQPDSKALYLRTTLKSASPWLVQAQAGTVVPLRKGEVCLVTFMARAVETSNEMGEATLGVRVEHSGQPRTAHLYREVKLGREWTRIFLPFAVMQDEAAGEAQCNLVVGFMPQAIEVADVRLLNYSNKLRVQDLPVTSKKVTYVGREPDAPWRKAAAARIEQYRKAPLTIVVSDAQGRPVSDAQVAVVQDTQAYGFGAAVTAKLLTEDSPDAQRYRQIVEKHFPVVVLENDLKVSPWIRSKANPSTGEFNHDNTMKALRWLKERDIAVRGHTLLWAPLDKKGFYSAIPELNFDGNDATENIRLLNQHVDDILTQTNGFVDEWDVVNHPVRTFKGKLRSWGDAFGREYYATLFHKARAANPKMRLFINEGTILPGGDEETRARYEETIAWLLEHKAPVDGIGFMGHFGEAGMTGPEQVYALLERYGKFGLAMRITEFDVSTGGDEQAQADYLRDVMTVFFSHPLSDGIVMWGFWEGRHWRPDAALWRMDWDIKPVGEMWLDLVYKQWRTSEQGKTNADGEYALRGFHGDYTITVTAKGQTQKATLTLDKDGERCVVRLK